MKSGWNARTKNRGSVARRRFAWRNENSGGEGRDDQGGLITCRASANRKLEAAWQNSLIAESASENEEAALSAWRSETAISAQRNRMALIAKKSGSGIYLKTHLALAGNITRRLAFSFMTRAAVFAASLLRCVVSRASRRAGKIVGSTTARRHRGCHFAGTAHQREGCGNLAGRHW